MNSPQSTDFLTRLDTVRGRFSHLASGRSAGLTAPDDQTGERWDSSQVWAHLAEFIPYWLTAAEALLAARSSQPVPFGRTKSDADRIAAIERGRRRSIAEQWQTLQEDMNDLRAFLDEMPTRGWELRGEHPTLGVMPMTRIVDEFLVGHLEEHANQLETLSPG